MAEILEKDKDGKPFPYYRWKIEGKVATIQTPLTTKLPTCSEYLKGPRREEYLINILKDWKAKGVEIVEFYMDPKWVDLAVQFFGSHGIKMDVGATITTMGRDLIRCQLLL